MTQYSSSAFSTFINSKGSDEHGAPITSEHRLGRCKGSRAPIVKAFCYRMLQRASNTVGTSK